MVNLKDIKVVIGANYGDEGKGLITDYLVNEYKETYGGEGIVILTNGGAQRGHTVVTPEGDEHTFHHFGSGTFAGADTYFPKQFIVNPIIFIKEYSTLIRKCKIPKDIWLNVDCLVSTPYDMLANAVIENSRGDNRHGSVGVGIWETLVRVKAESLHGFDVKTKTVSELRKMTDDEIDKYLLNVALVYYVPYLSNEHNTTFGSYAEVVSSEALRRHWITDFRNMCSICKFVTSDGVINTYDFAVFENAQGLLLDKSLEGKEGHTTPSKTDLTYVKDILEGVPGAEYVRKEVVFVTRSYLTKHGAGDILPEHIADWEAGKMLSNVPEWVKDDDETNVPNDYQGTLKYANINWEDLNFRINSVEKYGFRPSIAITHLDEAPCIIVPDHDVFKHVYLSYGRTRKDIKEQKVPSSQIERVSTLIEKETK